MIREIVYWLTDEELVALAAKSIEHGVSLDEAVNKIKDAGYVIYGRQVSLKKFVKAYHARIVEVEISNFWNK